MKTYLCRKTVTAARITHVANLGPSMNDPLGGCLELTLEDGSQVHECSAGPDQVNVGDYLVREFDGQTSVQAATIFERWHALLVDTGRQVHPDSGLPSQRQSDYFASMDAAQMQSLGIERERRERRESFDRMERQQIERSRKQG